MPGAYFPKWVWPKGLEGKWIKIGETFEELALQMNVDPAALRATISRFNKYAASGQDPDFERGKSAYDRYYADNAAGKNPCLRPLGSPPYYAVQLFPGDLGTKGGFVVNEQAQVIDKNNRTISGLYAAGNAAANPIGNIYPGAGGTLGPGLTFGYIAADHMLEPH